MYPNSHTTSTEPFPFTRANPIHCSIAPYTHSKTNNQYLITVYGIDIYGILSHIVGTMSLQQLDIRSASSESNVHKDTATFRNQFIVNAKNVYNDAWQENIQEFILEQGMLLYAQKRDEALKRILERIAADYEKSVSAVGHPPIIDIRISPLKTAHGENTFEVHVEGRDSRYLLYMLTMAFEQQRLTIHSCSVKTHKSHVEDIFVVQAIDENNAIDESELRMKLVLTIQFAYYLRFAANPYKAMMRFQEIITNSISHSADDPRKFMVRHSEIASLFAQILGSGDYLWEDFIRANSEETIKTLTHVSDEKLKKDIGLRPAQYEAELIAQCSKASSFEEKIRILNAFKDSQSHFIDLDVLLRYKKNFRELSHRLSELARVVMRQASYLVYERLCEFHGEPTTAAGVAASWLLCGLGKFGGSALGYASDIEIMLLYDDAGSTNGKEALSNKNFFEKMVRCLCENIYSKRNGIFQIDTRIRPYGEDGPLAVRLDNFIEYYSENGNAHSVERLALSRMRPVSGTPNMAERVLTIRDTLLYKVNSINRQEIFAMRESQRKSRVKPKTRNAKFSLGALVDVEYNIQMLQIEHGIAHPKLRQPSVHNALMCLQEIGEISEEECNTMLLSYQFFRSLINALRLRRGNALDLTVPKEETWELEHLSRRMGYKATEISASRQLLADFDMHSMQTHQFVKKHLGDAAMPALETSPASLPFARSVNEARSSLRIFKDAEKAFEAIRTCAHGGEAFTQGTSLVQEAKSDDAVISEEVTRMFSRILLLSWKALDHSGDSDRVIRDFARIVTSINQEGQAQTKERAVHTFYAMLLRQPTRLDMLLQILSGSRYIAEELIKSPQIIFTVLEKNVLQRQKKYEHYRSEIFLQLQKTSGNTTQDVLRTLRVYKKQETLRIICRDICLSAPFENVVAEISDLARAIVHAAFIASVYDNAAALEQHAGLSIDKERRFDTNNITAIEESIPMSILAFGKCGARELNYSSDLDLLCVYKKGSSMPEEACVKIMQRTMWYLTHHTHDGWLYRIDMRLRPYGEASSIASSTAFVEQYYKTDARFWELQAALKLGALAGNVALAQQCIEGIHAIVAQRMAQEETARSIARKVHEMRVQAVAEHIKNIDEGLEVKNSWGGIRDIEFTTQLLQCTLMVSRPSKMRKIFSDTISTIWLLHKNNFMSYKEAQRIVKDYCFLRRVEHFLQVYDDKQLHAIPQNDKTCISRITWLTMNEQDEDSFMNQLAHIKRRSHAWYKTHVASHASY